MHGELRQDIERLVREWERDAPGMGEPIPEGEVLAYCAAELRSALSNAEPAPEVGYYDGQHATCRRCGRGIVWYFDFDEDDEPDAPGRYGFWYARERMTSACIPGANDEDMYHEPTKMED